MDKITQAWFDTSTVRVERGPELLGWHSDEELIRLSGAPRDSRLKVSVLPEGAIEFRVSNTKVLREDMVRLLVQEADGHAFVLVNAVFVLHDRLLGRGIGPRSVAIELEQARQLGYITRVRTWAVGDQSSFFSDLPLRGYYVWPLMGFDAPLPQELLGHPDLPLHLGCSPSLADVLDAPGGDVFWFTCRSSIWLEFSLAAGSKSWKRLRRYTSERHIEVNP